MAKGKKTGGRTRGTPNKRQAVALKTLDGYAAKTGLPGLMAIAEDQETPIAVRVDVWKYLADRELGKPRQALEQTGKDGGPIILRWAGEDVNNQ